VGLHSAKTAPGTARSGFNPVDGPGTDVWCGLPEGPKGRDAQNGATEDWPDVAHV
jgi:hypothetical protein